MVCASSFIRFILQVQPNTDIGEGVQCLDQYRCSNSLLSQTCPPEATAFCAWLWGDLRVYPVGTHYVSYNDSSRGLLVELAARSVWNTQVMWEWGEFVHNLGPSVTPQVILGKPLDPNVLFLRNSKSKCCNHLAALMGSWIRCLL